MATVKEKVFSVGDWVSHPYHGVGKVTDVETKHLSGDESKFYRVETEDSIFWIPVEEAEEGRSRPVVTDKELKETLDVLRGEPEEMAQNYRTRQSRIQKIMAKGSLRGIAKMVRDLAARRREKSLNTIERRSYRHFRKSLIDEWSKVEGITENEVQSNLRKLLREGRKKNEE
jgi:CarD family transcriptional regulator